MKQLKLIIAAFFLISPFVANADLIRMDAASKIGILSDFFIVYEDTGDGLLQFDEVVEFSGFTWGTSIFDLLARIPNITGISTLSNGPLGEGLETYNDWIVFSSSGGSGSCDRGDPTPCWEYSSANVSVPEPGTLALLGLGLAGMGMTRRKKKV